jgi:hypothetical protein
MVGELHKRGYQGIRVMPFMSPSGMHWRCWIGPATLFYRNHGAVLLDATPGMEDTAEVQATAQVARYTSGQGNRYFDWQDAEKDNARALADKFFDRFRTLAASGHRWDYAYAGWHQRLLGLAEAGWLPIVLTDYNAVSFDRIPLDDFRPMEWRRPNEEIPNLPFPPGGQLQQDYKG